MIGFGAVSIVTGFSAESIVTGFSAESIITGNRLPLGFCMDSIMGRVSVECLTAFSVDTDFVFAALHSNTRIDALTSFTAVRIQHVAEFTLFVAVLRLALVH